MLGGFPMDVAARLRKLTQKQLIVAGGIRSQEEVDALEAIGRGCGGGHGGLYGSAEGLMRNESHPSCKNKDAARVGHPVID